MSENIEKNDKLALAFSWDLDRDIWDEMEACYLDYAMSVIKSRALPDVRDGLKPVHRRIIYVMEKNNLRASSKFRKSATVVWDVLWKYHPHGDSSVYQAMVRLAQDFSLRYPLVNGQWNFGSIDGDNAAAMRYTESKMQKLAEYMVHDLHKDTIDWEDNYDATEKEPGVLPAKIPNLLMNGVMWIAVWMATNIPPHNLTELLSAIQFMIEHENPEEITIEDLMQYITGPDFPTGWEIYDKEIIAKAYATGRGSVIMRGVANISEGRNGRKQIIITEIPYQVVKSSLVIKIADLVKDKKIVWISDLRDESNKDSIRVVVELKKDAFPKKILNQLFKLTQLQSSFGFNMIALWERWTQPKLYNLKEILEEFIVHRKEIVTRRTAYDLALAEARAHILEGLKTALDHIERIISTIRASKSKEDAKIALIAAFSFSEKQADAILDMQLSKLAWLEREKIENELAEKLLIITDLKDILGNPVRVVNIISEEVAEIKEKFGDARRTKVNSGKIWEFNAKDTIPNEDVIISLSKNSYIKRINSSLYRSQKRWGKWTQTWTKENDELRLMLSTKSHNDLLFFTNKWRVFSLPAYEIPDTSRTAKWQPIINLLSLQKGEEVYACLDITQEKNDNLIFVTKNWTVKKLEMEQVKNIRASGLIVLKVKEDDELCWVMTTGWEDHVFIATKTWKAIQFSEEDVRPMGRAASWVRWIKLKADDEVVQATIVSHDDKYVFVVSENGMWKLTAIEEYRSQNRWGSWVKTMSITAKTWSLVSAMTLSEEEKKDIDIILVSKAGQTIRMSISSIRATSRVTQWVILTKVKWENDTIVSASWVRKSEESEADADVENNDEE